MAGLAKLAGISDFIRYDGLTGYMYPSTGIYQFQEKFEAGWLLAWASWGSWGSWASWAGWTGWAGWCLRFHDIS